MTRPHRIAASALVLPFAILLCAHAEKARKPAPPLAAAQYPMHDAHTHEHVTIAAEPADTKATSPDTRLDYLAHRMMPIRVIVTNDSDQPLTLDDARIDLIAADNTKVPAATTDDLNRRLFEIRQTRPTNVPIIGIKVHHKPVDSKILADDADFGFKTTTVAAHTTVAGYLFYDMEGLPSPALENATLELRRVRWARPEGAGSLGPMLDSFEIPLHAAASSDAAAKPH